MKSFDFDAVTYEGEVYCTNCLPDGIDSDSDDVSPIFADSEWEYMPICSHCGEEHDYVSLIGPGYTEPEEEDITTEDYLHFWQSRKLVLTIGEDDDMESALQEYMESASFFPDVWFISDHGNAHRIKL